MRSRRVIGFAGAVLWVASVGLAVSADPATNEDLRDGQIVVSVERRDEPGGMFKFHLIDLATGTTQTLVDYTNGFQATAPSWSPDGRYLLVSMNRDCAGVYIYDTTERSGVRLDEPGDYEGACRAVWSPDGFQIVLPEWTRVRLPSRQKSLRPLRVKTFGRESIVD